MEEKFPPDMQNMNLEEKQGAASALKKLAERRFRRFEREIQEMIDKEHYEEDDFRKVKEIKKDTEVITDKYEEILTYLDSAYSAKPKKMDKELKEVTENFDEIEQRRDTVRQKIKEANEHIETERTKDEVKIKEEDKRQGRQLSVGTFVLTLRL